MVHLKASTGCYRCRERRIKCDEAKPECNRCLKRGLACTGYRSVGGVVFVDAGKAFKTPKAKPVKVADDSMACIKASPIQELSIDPQTLSVCFFLQNFVLSPDRDKLLSRGHFDNLVQMYVTAPSNSAIALATSVMAACVWQQYHIIEQDSNWQIEQQMNAHLALKKAIVDPAESLRDETLMAIVLMDFAAGLTLNPASQAASRVHMLGALALADKRGDNSFTSDPSLSSLAALRSNVLLYSLWAGDKENYRSLKQVPDVRPNNESMAASLHYYLAKAIVLDADAEAAHKANMRGEAKLEREYWVTSATELLSGLDEWFECLPIDWKLAVSHGPTKASGWYSHNQPPIPVLSLVGQWHCIKLNLIRLIANISADAKLQHQNNAQGRIIFENLRALFPHFENSEVDGEKALLDNFMYRAATYGAPIGMPSVYKSTRPSGSNYLLPILRWLMTHVRDKDWSLQPRAEWIAVEKYLLSEQNRHVALQEQRNRENPMAHMRTLRLASLV